MARPFNASGRDIHASRNIVYDRIGKNRELGNPADQNLDTDVPEPMAHTKFITFSRFLLED